MGRYSEIDILLQTLPIDREDEIFAPKSIKNIDKNRLEQISIWDFTDEELLQFISGRPMTETYSIILNRIIAEKQQESPKVYQNKRG